MVRKRSNQKEIPTPTKPRQEKTKLTMREHIVSRVSSCCPIGIWDPVGSDTSILISRLFYIKIHFFMSYENESSDLKYDLRKNRKMYNSICLYVRAFATSALTFTSVKHDAIIQSYPKPQISLENKKKCSS